MAARVDSLRTTRVGSSKPVRPCNPRLGQFDSGASPCRNPEISEIGLTARPGFVALLTGSELLGRLVLGLRAADRGMPPDADDQMPPRSLKSARG